MSPCRRYHPYQWVNTNLSCHLASATIPTNGSPPTSHTTGVTNGDCATTIIELTADITLTGTIALTLSHDGLTIQSGTGNQYALDGDDAVRPMTIIGTGPSASE